MDANVLRKELEGYCITNGIKYRHIAKEINTSESMLCHWRKGRKKLSTAKFELLKQIINVYRG